MLREMDGELKQYYKSISRALVCDKKEKRHILDAIKNSIDCYISDNPDAGVMDIIAHFGSANDVAAEYYNGETPWEITTKIKNGKQIIRVVVIAIAIALLVYLLAIVAIVIADVNALNGYNEVIVEEALIKTPIII